MEELRRLYRQETGVDVVDSLTGLFNHGFFHIYFDECLKQSREAETPVSLALINIELFSNYNSRNGYIEGDKLLREMAQALKDAIRLEDFASRIQTDNFAVLFDNADSGVALQAANRIRHRLLDAFGEKVALAIGVATHPQDGNSRQALLSAAGQALQEARIRGQNQVMPFQLMADNVGGEAPQVLIVDDDETNAKLLETMIAPLKFTVHQASDGVQALHIVEKNDIDLVLLDIMMPGMSGFEVCRRLKSSENTRQIPVILITALDDMDARLKGIDAGADDFLSKPANMQELQARAKSLVRVRGLNRDYANIEYVLFSLANAVEAKDSSTQGHTERVANLATALGEKMGLSGRELSALRLGGILHDIGKIGISEEILNKPGLLTDDEWEQMKRHAEIGYQICLPLAKSLGGALDIIRHHHEKLDGDSYPDGLRAAEITMGARIMAVVDIYDALITDRPYRRALTTDRAVEILREESAAGKLDEEVVELLISSVFNSETQARRRTDDKTVSIKTILIIEDDPLNLKLVKALLGGDDYRLQSAENAETGIQMAREILPDLILMDIQLPGLDGLEATKIIKKDDQLKTIPVVAISAYAMQSDIEAARMAGCDEYLTKPLDTKAFKNAVSSYF